jgi:hypothetical protein
MMKILKLERREKEYKQRKDGNRVRKYRCESCYTMIGSEGLCGKCEEKKGDLREKRKKDLREKRKMCQDWLDGILGPDVPDKNALVLY